MGIRKRTALFLSFSILAALTFSSYSIVEHQIQSNETLYRISIEYNVSISTILDWNPNLSPNNLKIEQVILIPQPEGYIYEVKKGDNLTYIAKLFFTSVSDIVKANNLDTTTIFVNQKLFIPKSVVGKGFNNERNIIWPVYATISSLYGYRVHPITKEYSFHKGIDLAAPIGTPVFSVEAGKVKFVGENGGYGLMVEIESYNNSYVYGHLSQINVYEGQYVEKGEIIARVGNTGLSTGPHLHFEVKKAYTNYDPLVFLPSSNRIYVLDNRENEYGLGGN
ncbi:MULTISPECIES: M23 family metallopeptidase [Petrotoga]|uniref:Murein DD-endopeptidase MepM/ murein hydrolase activator NlpD n=1 Tax=Petrotoga sibirica TaxID=156202 RepID=A0A4R8F2B3_9BACT|nr:MULTISPECIES: M23 family metallopeptidase [Petrotoga]KUK82278.1 MAG: Peptidase M23B [Petrotoga mobilis]TDX17345.1 murein DD-endopeptidase MepM/ murein hydrolase activator NlpD [Petrotoga sibirica]